jgi:hypothetical protein
VHGSLFLAQLLVYEVMTPYCLIITCSTPSNNDYPGHTLRIDVLKDDLGKELKLWLDGKIIRHPSVLTTQRIDETISKFIRLGKPPIQEDLIMWILSRTELVWGEHAEMLFGGGLDDRYVGANTRILDDNNNQDIDRDILSSLKNDYPRTVSAANDRNNNSNYQNERINRAMTSNNDHDNPSQSQIFDTDNFTTSSPIQPRPSSAPGTMKSFNWPGIYLSIYLSIYSHSI